MLQFLKFGLYGFPVMFRKSLSKWRPTVTAMVSSPLCTSTRRSSLPVVSSGYHDSRLYPSFRHLSTQTTTRQDDSTNKRGGGGDEGRGDGTGFFSKQSITGTDDEEEEDYWSDGGGWEEEEDDAEAQIGDGGDGGGVVLRGVDWGERVFSIANEVLDLHFDTEDVKIFAFKVSPKGYIYVRLDKLSHKYGCPSMNEIEHFNRLYKDKLEEYGKCGEIPNNLAIEVSSPGALRLLNVPDELERFKDIPLLVTYLEEDAETHVLQKKDGVFFLDSMDVVAGHCTWKLADVKENVDPLRKGRPLSKKKKEWRLTLPYETIKRVAFYLSF